MGKKLKPSSSHQLQEYAYSTKRELYYLSKTEGITHALTSLQDHEKHGRNEVQR